MRAHSLRTHLLTLTSCIAALLSLAEANISFKLYRDVPESKILPAYTPEERVMIARQAQALMDIYVNRECKLKLYGHHIDPVPIISHIVSKAATMTDAEFHTQMFSLFHDLHDPHTTYHFPASQRCYTTAAPFSFEVVEESQRESAQDAYKKGGDGMVPDDDDDEILPDVSEGHAQSSGDYSGNEPRIAVRMVTKRPDVLTLLTPAESAMLQKVQPGDILVRYNGRTFKEFVEANGGCGGASPAGKLAFCARFLSFRSGMQDVLHEFVEDEFVLRRGWREFVVRVPIVAQIDETCLRSLNHPNPPPEHPPGVDLYCGECLFGSSTNLFKAFYGQPKLGYELYDTVEPMFSWSILPQHNVGILRIESFNPFSIPLEAAVMLIRDLLVNAFTSTYGLIVDVRGNTGGSLDLAERLLQLFTHNRIEPAQFRAVVSETNQRIFNTHQDFQGSSWQEAFNEAPPGDLYTRLASLSSEKQVNLHGQAFLKPVAVFTNAECYSACELFAAGFQDYDIGPVFGEDPTTGGGGANVVDVNHFLSTWLPAVFKPLPGGQNMGVSWRQSVRTGRNAGKLIEDVGVQSDQVLRPSPMDFREDNPEYAALQMIVSQLVEGGIRSGRSFASCKDSQSCFTLCFTFASLHLLEQEPSLHPFTSHSSQRIEFSNNKILTSFPRRPGGVVAAPRAARRPGAGAMDDEGGL
ncbi:hypothetical protein HK102_007906 [Quaeritorhiza haematococci]|nr:hypothetical protein HK102_007906 [Quaeritorhiza haematococci]